MSAWNRVTNVSGFNGQPVAAPLTLPSSGVSSETGTSSLHYYVRFTLNNGTALTVDANKLFALDDFSFSDDQTLNIGSQSSGAGAGKVTFDPLHLSFSQLGLDPTLFKMLASGQTFKEIDVLGYDASGDSSHLAVDYSFGLTAAKTLSVDASGITQLDLEYGSEELQVYNQHPDGSFSSTPDEVSAWNRVTNVSGFNGQPVAAPLTLPSSGVSSETGDLVAALLCPLHAEQRHGADRRRQQAVRAGRLLVQRRPDPQHRQPVERRRRGQGHVRPPAPELLAAWARPHAVQDAGLGPDVQGGRCSRL